MSLTIKQIAKGIVTRDKPFFDSLIEFEKTGKIRSKTRLNFTINKTTSYRFKQYCKRKGHNMSAKIEQAMQDIIEQEK